MKINEEIIYVGVNDHKIDLFEGQYDVPNGMAYNSYVILDEKIAVLDTVDAKFTHEWLDNVQNVLGGRKPDYLIIHHMEPDHSANILNFINLYPDVKIVASIKAFVMMKNFFGNDFKDNQIVVGEKDTLSLGKHNLTFITATMVHWPEVMVSYDSYSKVLFSADAFGKFGALDVDEDWACEARRYYIGIVGKYGVQVQTLLKKIGELDVQTICPLHGPVLTENLDYYLNLYNVWSNYGVESEGVVIAYTSVYGNTKKAVKILAEKLESKGCPKVVINDLARCDMAEAVEDAFRYGKIVLATTTYNGEIFPFMREFIDHLTERNFQNKTVAFIENGSWLPMATKIMKEKLSKSKNLTFAENEVKILSALNEESSSQLEALSDELTKEYENKELKDGKTLFNLGYGLYVITCFDGKKDNGLIVNTVSQVAINPERIAVTINKENYSYHVIKNTGKMNVNCLTVEAPFKVFESFGFTSGRKVNKFEDCSPNRSLNGLIVLPKYINSYLSLEVEDYVDLGSHGMFVCSISESKILSDKDSMTYSYYHANVKPKPEVKGAKGYVCKICGYVYEGETLPEDFICPWCKHPASDFEEIK